VPEPFKAAYVNNMAHIAHLFTGEYQSGAEVESACGTTTYYWSATTSSTAPRVCKRCAAKV
jgi:hypothetical protein